MVITAIPKITDQYHSLSDVGWYGSSYFLSAAVGYLVFRKVYVLWQCATGLLLATIIFNAGSALCLTPAFLAGRALSGFGGAGILSGVSEISVMMFPQRAQRLSLGLAKATFCIASTGSLVGGALADRNWKMCFSTVSNVLE